MRIAESLLSIERPDDGRRLISHFREAIAAQLPQACVPTRFVVTKTDPDRYECEVGFVEALQEARELDNLFHFVRRRYEATDAFTAVLLVPTGVGASIGGHAGDAGPVAKLLASVCDTLVTHPNVVNASDINELPENALYVEGSVLTRLMMGAAALQRVRSNRVLVVMDAHQSELLGNASINAVNAARAAYGFDCPKIVRLEPPIVMRSEFNASGRSSGSVSGFAAMFDALKADRDLYDAVAVASVIKVPPNFHQDYFDLAGEMVNPWGGVEALLTHAISALLDVPSAHSPMFENEEIANADCGVVDPRMAPEAVSVTFLQCILKGLQRAPKVIRTSELTPGAHPGLVCIENVSCLIIPEGCVGLPTLAAVEQGIPVIAVRENKNLMQNDLEELPWAPGQLHFVDSYLEAAGVMAALKAGVTPASVRRPLPAAPIETKRRSALAEPSPLAVSR